jgi:AcrR family transcriptional regulator
MNKADAFNKMIQEADSTKQRLLYSAIFLFSTKGYDSVGIRELTSSVNIKESAFYNHFKSKEILFTEILNQFIEISNIPVFTKEELEEVMKSGNIEYFLKKNMQVYSNICSSPLYYTLLQIILMEGYTNIKAWQLIKYTDYYLELEKILEHMMDSGFIKNMNIKAVTASYYYGIKGIIQEFILKKVWSEDTTEMTHMIENHIDLFVKILKNEG